MKRQSININLSVSNINLSVSLVLCLHSHLTMPVYWNGRAVNGAGAFGGQK